MKYPLQAKAYIYAAFTPLLVIFLALSGSGKAQEREDEETYSISLVKTAEDDREIVEVEGKKVLTESYTVKKGDYIWGILRRKGLLDKRNSNEIISLLGRLNPTLKDLNLIYPGEKIIIPLIASPIKDVPAPLEKRPGTPVPLEEIKDLDLKYYTIKPGDCLIKVVKDLYDIPEEDLYDEYLNILKKMNPSISDIDNIYPGQRVRIPIYSPEIVRSPIKPAPPGPIPETMTDKKDLEKLGGQLKEIFTLIGEGWIDTGTHFIPLKSGGQINLNADSYPIIDLRSGSRLILDIYNKLPGKIADLIISNWDNYRIVRIERSDDLTRAVNRIMDQCGYDKVYRRGEPLLYGGEISLRINADWIVESKTRQPIEKDHIVALDLCDENSPRIPDTIRTFLEGLGIRYIEYPQISGAKDEPPEEMEIIETGDDRSAVIETLLKLMGIPFSRDLDIPIYQSEETDFDLIIKADFFLSVGGRDGIIDLDGLGRDITNLLQEHGFLVLSMTDVKAPSVIVTRTLEFLSLEFDSKRHTFLALDGEASDNVRLTIPGIIFRDKRGRRIFATHLKITRELGNFLGGKDYLLWRLSPLESS